MVSEILAGLDGQPAEGLWVFVDIGGVRELAALVRLIPYISARLGACVVVVKSKRYGHASDACLFTHTANSRTSGRCATA